MHIILQYCPSRWICKQANILSHATCSYYRTTDSCLSAHRLTSISTQKMNSQKSYVYIATCHMHIILHYCPSFCQANILSCVTCSYYHTHRLTSICTQEMNSQNSYVYIATCHMHIILHYCPSFCQANILSHVTCSYYHTHRLTSISTQTHVYLHTGDILRTFICIYCHLPHAFNTTLLPVVLSGKYIATCHLLILPQ